VEVRIDLLQDSKLISTSNFLMGARKKENPKEAMMVPKLDVLDSEEREHFNLRYELTSHL